MEISSGTVVISRAGRDKGLAFVVLRTEDGYGLLADGKCRKLANPKRKKRMHITPTEKKIPLENLTDKKLRKLLAELFDTNSAVV